MTSVGRFEKVSLSVYAKARRKMNPDISDSQIRNEYDDIKLPTRATAGSAGYDFSIPYAVKSSDIKSGVVSLPTGVRWVSYPIVSNCSGESRLFELSLHMRSSTASKLGFSLVNGTGIIDADYHMADNEGNIIIKLMPNNVLDTPARAKSSDAVIIDAGEKIVQGIFSEVFIVDENPSQFVATRIGGFGSTGKF